MHSTGRVCDDIEPTATRGFPSSIVDRSLGFISQHVHSAGQSGENLPESDNLVRASRNQQLEGWYHKKAFHKIGMCIC